MYKFILVYEVNEFSKTLYHNGGLL